MAIESQERLADEYAPWLLDDLLQPHTLGRSFYMRPSSRPQIADKLYADNASYWRDVLEERIGAERNVTLKNFNVFEWVPRNPGLFHTPGANFARQGAQHYARSIERHHFDESMISDGAIRFRTATLSDGTVARIIIYTPQGKISMLKGGVGCVRFKPLQLRKGGTAWLMSATSSTAPDEGIPLLIGNDDYLALADDLQSAGAVCCDVFGRTKFVADEFSDLFSIRNGIPRLYVEVSAVKLHRAMKEPGQVSVAASFLSAFEGASKIYASYVTFDPGRRGARLGAANWLKEEYVEKLYEGSLLTDFDQRAPLFANALFTLDQVLSSPDLAAKIDKLKHLYGAFDWAQLDRFSYIEHEGDLIVTNNTITVTNSSNVVIQSHLSNAQLTAGTLSAGDDAQRKQLQSLLQQLQEALPKASFDKSEQAEALAAQTKGIVDEAAKAQPNKTLLKSMADGLKTTAGFLKDTVPAVVTISAQIVTLIGKLHGIV
jgi:hypothetical protein